MSRIAFVLLLAFAATAGTAHAGGWATVELGAPAPGSLDAGEPWRVELIVKQHGVTPLDGVTPSVKIDNGAGVVQSFPARPTGRPGTYAAEVTYPAAGMWKTRIYDGLSYGVPHRLKPMTVAPVLGAAAPADGGFPWPQVVAVALVALLFLGGILATLPLPRPRFGTATLRGRAA